MELLGMMIYNIMPDSLSHNAFFIIGLLGFLLFMSEILPAIPQKYIKSNGLLHFLWNMRGPIVNILTGMKRRVVKNTHKANEEIISEYEAGYDLKRDPLNAEKKK